jgi:hypothetical protein
LGTTASRSEFNFNATQGIATLWDADFLRYILDGGKRAIDGSGYIRSE